MFSFLDEDAAEAAVGAGSAGSDEAIVVGATVLASGLEFGGGGFAVDAPFPNIAENAIETKLVGGGIGYIGARLKRGL